MTIRLEVPHSLAKLDDEHGSPVCRAERKLIQASTVEPDPDHAGAGRQSGVTSISYPVPSLTYERHVMSASTESPSVSPSRPKVIWRWRVVDIVVAAVIGVTGGVLYWGWTFPAAGFAAVLPGVQSLGYGLWLLAGVLAALVIRKPGAALFAELVAAVVEALIGNQWGGPVTILYGVVEGLGAELIFALFLYTSWRVWTAMLAGGLAGIGGGILDLVLYTPAHGVTAAYITTYLVCFAVSGAILAGVVGWLIVRALVPTGALNRFALGRQQPAV